MSNTTEQILLTLGARNNASNIFNQVDKDAHSMASSISSAISSINSGLMNIGSVTDNVMQGLTGKSAMDNILGVSSKAETNKVLVKNMLDDTEKNFDSFYDNVDKVTDSSLISMQELMPALKAFKSATGAADKDVENVTDEIANFGAAVLAQTGSTDLAQQSMMDLSKGIKGAFASLDQYGITKDALERTGYWNGDENDVKGFMKAVQKVTGSTEELMETNQGLDAQIGKAFSRAGKKMGNEFLPVIKDIKKGFLELDDSLGGNLTASILAVSGGVEVMNQGLWNVSTTVNGVRDLADGFKFLTDKIKGVTEAAETASDAVNTMSNISDMGANASGIGGAIGAGANIAGASSIPKEIPTPNIDLDPAEILFQNYSKDAKDVIKEEKEFKKTAEKMVKNYDDFNVPNGFFKTDLTDDMIKEMERADWGLTDAIKDSFSQKGKKIGDAAEAGGESLQKGLKKMTDVPTKMSKSFHSFTESLTTSVKDFKDGGVKGNFKKLDQKLLSVFKGTEELSEVVVTVNDMTDVSKAVSGAEDIAEGVSGIAGVGSAVAATAPELEAAAVGGAAVEAGATGLAATFSSLMVPLLAVSAAIIIMIPIVSVIAAEAMLFIRLLADFMDALNFDNINLDGAIKGLQSLTTAFLWVGAAMLTLSAVNLTTALAALTSNFFGMTGPLQHALDALSESAKLLQQFNTVKVDPTVSTNLQTISDSLTSVSNAMLALTGTNITVGFSNFISWALGFGSVTAGLEQAKNDIIQASSKLNEFSGLTPIPDDVANNIQNVCDSLASVGNAMTALREMRDGQNWDDMIGGFIGGLFGEGLNIQQALDAVKKDISDAATALSNWTDLPKIPDGLGEKITSISTSLTSLNDAFQTLRSFRDDNIWDDMIGGIFGETDINQVLGDIITDLNNAATKLGELKVDSVKETTTTGITNIGDALNKLSEVSSTFTSFPDTSGFDSTLVSTAVTNIKTIATQLSSLGESTFSGDGVDSVLNSIQTTMENLKNTLSAASGFSEPATNIGSQIINGVKSGLSPLTSTVTGEVSAATNSGASAGWTGGAYIGQSTGGGFKSALDLHTTMTTEMGYVKDAVDKGISEAKTAAQNGAAEIVQAFQAGINVGSPGDIARTMKQEMIYTKDFILGAYGDLKKSAYGAGRLVVDSFGNPNLNLGVNNTFSQGNIQGWETLSSKVPVSQDNRTIIMYNNVTVDARNKTEKEATSILTLALEGMDHITNIDVDV